MKRLVVYPEKCTGCRQCELSCSFIKTRKFGLTNARLGVVIWEEDGWSVPAICQQCDDAECMRVCPTGAITRIPLTGAVEVSHRLCVGCRSCFTACPIAGMCLSEDGRPIKCDLCGGDPECVKACVPEALAYEDDVTAVGKKRRAVCLAMAPARVVRRE